MSEEEIIETLKTKENIDLTNHFNVNKFFEAIQRFIRFI